MKKIICVCLCICLMSGCDKSLRHGRPANAVAEDKGSEGVSTHSLTSDTSALAPSNTPAPTPEPSKSALPASDTADTGSSVGKYAVNAVLCAVALAFVCYGGYKLLYRFADIKPVSLGKYDTVKDTPEGCKKCYFINGHFFDWDTNRYIDETPVEFNMLKYYKSNPFNLKPLLRKIFGIEVPKSPYKPNPYNIGA
ncbi:hypothetical protein [Candidatus Endomicrobiellum agilis]|uniref:hypothetical protein n=1 Tax=Candidatus Endomicrobiellum agilis TaxID=3238957 RepID=UPI003578C23A|nr:hypothetical protein [Endomicrobium sp.]